MEDILIVYDSRTGNVQRFIEKLKDKVKWTCHKIDPDLQVDSPYHLLTYTTGFGKIPDSTIDFLKRNELRPSSVSSSGNMNWGELYGVAANKINEEYGVPILMKFELSGTQSEVDKFITRIRRINGN